MIVKAGFESTCDTHNLTSSFPVFSRLFHILILATGIMKQIHKSNPDSLCPSGRTAQLEPGCSFPSESATFLLGNFKEKKCRKCRQSHFLLQVMHKLLNTFLVWSFKSHRSSFLPELTDVQRAARRIGLFPGLGAVFLRLPGP